MIGVRRIGWFGRGAASVGSWLRRRVRSWLGTHPLDNFRPRDAVETVRKSYDMARSTGIYLLMASFVEEVLGLSLPPEFPLTS